MNFSTSYAINEEIRVGIAGYYLKQINAHEIDGVSQANSK